jgi:hypothetical protein
MSFIIKVRLAVENSEKSTSLQLKFKVKFALEDSHNIRNSRTVSSLIAT